VHSTAWSNTVAERFIGSLRRELLDRILILNQHHAAALLAEYQQHFNEHRPHRALGQASPAEPTAPQPPVAGVIHRRQRLGGLINEYTYPQVA
jgi:transposase InsO family protein